jgi:ComEC/Rec2-related protein
MVALLLVGLLRLAQVPRRASALVAIPVLLIYVWATGARPGAVRSWLMAAVWLGAWTLVRPADLLNGMAAAALAILVWDPQQLFDGGFVLSFGAVAAIVVLTPRWEPRLTAVVAGDPFLPGRYAPWWRRLLAKPLVGTMKLASCSAAAWLGLLPLGPTSSWCR